MAHIFPGATWRPMPGQERRPKRRKGRGVGFHIAVSERASIYDINLGTGNDAHLYVRRDGTVEQNIDLDLQAWAGAAGNASMLWVETQGGTTPADVRSGRWTPQQAETLAQIAAYAHRTEGTPLDLMPDSRPASRGLATHRLGIKHSRGIGAVPGFLVAGGELWSSAVGKECPGDARVAQMPQVSARAKQIVAEKAPTSTPASAVPKEANTMRSVQLDNPTGDSPERSAVLTIDPVGASGVMPAGSRAWLQYQVFFPDAPADYLAEMTWLVFVKTDGKNVAWDPRLLKHRNTWAAELPVGCNAVEVVVHGIPKGGVVGFHIDGIGHA